MQYKHALERIMQKRDLSTSEATNVMDQIMDGKLTPAQIGGLLVAFNMKGEAINEITGMAKSMMAHAAHIKPKARNIIDTCGTGGDMSRTFNISTIAALVAAGAGAVVAKHGNRSVSSHCGSADVLEALGVNINLQPKQVEACINKIGIGFIYAPVFHSAMKHAVAPRKDLGVRTIFNLLGPLTNPGGAKRRLVGVYDENLTGVLALVLRNLGVKRAMVVHADDGLDEITISGPTKISEITRNGRINSYKISPEMFGLDIGSKGDLISQSIKENVDTIKMILKKQDIGPRRDAVLLNAGAAIYLADLAKDMAEGVKMAEASIDSGKAQQKLEALIEFGKKVGKNKPVKKKKK
ncbi:MAG: anthranilate phosphoribosyltransferase [Candidatus Margulisiibacteriota bacterium]|jgi:anthranilate phosphoribosyltransferase